MTKPILDFYGYFDDPLRLVELDVRLVAQDQHNHLGAWSGLPEVAALNLDLAVYETVWNSGRNDLLLGSTDENLHPHERWLYMWQWSEGQGWYEIDHHFGVLSYLNRKDFTATISGLSTGFDIQQTKLGTTWTTSHYWQQHHHKYDMAPIMQSLMIKGSITPVDLHDLTFHYHRWLARNPEYADMPRELVWRMHGLGEAAALAATHRAWGTKNFRNDGAFMLPDNATLEGVSNT